MRAVILAGGRGTRLRPYTEATPKALTPIGGEPLLGIVLAQLVHHGNEHRAHATTILGSHGRATPKIGAWTYGIANGISRNDGD